MGLPVVITEAQPDEKTLAKCLPYVRISRRADECGDCLAPHQCAAAYPGIRRVREDIAIAISSFIMANIFIPGHQNSNRPFVVHAHRVAYSDPLPYAQWTR